MMRDLWPMLALLLLVSVVVGAVLVLLERGVL